MIPGKNRCLNILLAVDGSEHAQAAVELLAGLPLASGSEVRILAVVPEHSDPHTTPQYAALEQAREALEPKGIQVVAAAVSGHPAETITTQAYQYDCDLIVLGALGRRRRMEFLLGGIAQQVVEHAGQPVLVVRAPYRPIKKVVLCVDGSDCSRYAVDFLSEMPLPEGVHILVTHVLAPLMTRDMLTRTFPADPVALSVQTSVSLEEMNEWQREDQAVGEGLLKQAVDRLEQAGLAASAHLLRGDAASEVIDFVKAQNADLVITGSRGLSSVKGWLLGSVSRKLAYSAGCSALIVRRPPPLQDVNDA